ncbi:MAG: porin family protein [Lewinella sp.]|jgi:hypothetical protein|uniref:porin family protein n=1 Tax=Lewinella sp. TaxID=2004506 RepID=UPI003D6B00E4
MLIKACWQGVTTISLWVFLLLSITLVAQEDSTAFRPQTYLGVQYGMNWNTVMFSPQIDQATLVANRVGAVFRYVGQAHLGIQLEVAYDQRGWAETLEGIAADYTREIDYLEFAAFSHISIGNGTVRPLVLLGSYLSYPVGQTETIPTSLDASLYQDYYQELLPERIQYGLAGGLGLEVFLDRLTLQLDGRYRSSLGGIFSSSDNRFIFSNSQGFTAQASVLFRVFGGK